MIFVSNFIEDFIEHKSFASKLFLKCRCCRDNAHKIDLVYYENNLSIFCYCSSEECYYRVPRQNFRASINIKDMNNISEEEYQLFINLYNKVKKVLLLT